MAQPAWAATVTFAPAQDYDDAGNGPGVDTSGDFNGDGKLDLAVTNFYSGTVSVLLGNGLGGFTLAPSSPITVEGSPIGITSADFNADGKLDLATANNNDPGTVSVLLGNGDGTFQAPKTLSVGVGAFPENITNADFNGDGKLDLAVTNADSNIISTFLGNGDGTFQDTKNLPLGANTNPRGITTGDFNADGHPDLAVTNFTLGKVSVLLGNGDGTFQHQFFNVGGSPFDLTNADFNGDGKLDLAVTDNDGNNVSVLLGNGDGTFQNAQSFNVGSQPTRITSADFNGDGKLDLAIANQGSNNVSVLLGNGDGTFQDAKNLPLGANTNPRGITSADFNRDGKPDLATADSNNPGTVSVLLNTTTFPPPVAKNDFFVTKARKLLSIAAPGVLSNDTDPGGKPLTAKLVSGPTHGSVTLNPDGSFLYAPQKKFHGADSFTYKANDGIADSNTATVTIKIGKGKKHKHHGHH